jgi:hypothetical protein
MTAIAALITPVQVAIGGDWLVALVPVAPVALCCGLLLLLLLLAGRRDRLPDGP